MKNSNFNSLWCACMPVCVSVCAMLAGTCGNQNVSDGMKLELEEDVSYLMWGLELSSGPMAEQQALLTTGPPLQRLILIPI